MAEATGTGGRSPLWRGVAVLIAGAMLLGVFAITPATAARFLTKKKALKLFYTKAQANQMFLGDTVTVVESVAILADTGNADPGTTESVSCPAGYEATGGGVDVDDTNSGGFDANEAVAVVSTAPTFGAADTFSRPNGQGAAANGWQASIQNSANIAFTAKIAVICAKT